LDQLRNKNGSTPATDHEQHKGREAYHDVFSRYAISKLISVAKLAKLACRVLHVIDSINALNKDLVD